MNNTVDEGPTPVNVAIPVTRRPLFTWPEITLVILVYVIATVLFTFCDFNLSLAQWVL